MDTNGREFWESDLATGLSPEARDRFPGLPAVIGSMSQLHRDSRTATWSVQDLPSVWVPRTPSQVDRDTAMIDRFHVDADGDSSLNSHLIVWVPTTRRELVVLGQATFQEDPLPVDHAILRNLIIDLQDLINRYGTGAGWAAQRPFRRELVDSRE